MNDTDKPLKLKELKIELHQWGDEAGKYSASIEYVGEYGTSKLTLDNQISMRLLSIIGPVITACAHKTSLKLEASLNNPWPRPRHYRSWKP